MVSFSLSLGDYSALAGLLLATTASNYLIIDAKIDASEARQALEVRASTTNLTTELSALSVKFDVLGGSISEAVNRGLQDRRNEVLLALTDFGRNIEGFQVTVANIPTDSAFLQDIQNFCISGVFGGGQVLAIGETSVATCSFQSIDAAKASSIVQMYEAAFAINDQIQVEFDLTPQSTWIGSADMREEKNDQIRELLEDWSSAN